MLINGVGLKLLHQYNGVVINIRAWQGNKLFYGPATENPMVIAFPNEPGLGQYSTSDHSGSRELFDSLGGYPRGGIIQMFRSTEVSRIEIKVHGVTIPNNTVLKVGNMQWVIPVNPGWQILVIGDGLSLKRATIYAAIAGFFYLFVRNIGPGLKGG